MITCTSLLFDDKYTYINDQHMFIYRPTCVYIYIHTHIHTYIHIYIYIHAHNLDIFVFVYVLDRLGFVTCERILSQL